MPEGVFAPPLNRVNTLSSEEYDCDSDDSSFDSRVKEKAKNLTMKHSRCLPPFLAEDDDDILCLNKTDGQEAFNNYLLAFDNARLKSPPPCKTNKINLRVKNQQNIIENLHMVFNVISRNRDSYSLFISFPSLVEAIESKEFYNWVSYVAEFSGWLGIFLGIGLPHIPIICDTIGAIRRKYLKQSNMMIKYTAYLLFGVVFISLGIPCIDKYFQANTSTEIQLTSPELLPTLSPSICKNKLIYSSSKFLESGSFLGHEQSFWDNNPAITDMISDISVIQNASIVSLWNKTMREDIKNQIYYPILKEISQFSKGQSKLSSFPFFHN